MAMLIYVNGLDVRVATVQTEGRIFQCVQVRANGPIENIPIDWDYCCDDERLSYKQMYENAEAHNKKLQAENYFVRDKLSKAYEVLK